MHLGGRPPRTPDGGTSWRRHQAGCFGGLRAARALRYASVRVTLVDRGNHRLFQPLLYQVATAELSPADISAPIRGVLCRQRNAEVALAEVTGVDVAERHVSLHDLATGCDRTLDYDYLIIAAVPRH